MSRISPAESYQIWSRFLEEWPLERLDEMSLQDYSHAGDTGTLTYWIEGETVKLGSISGGSSFKFGIYSRLDKSPRANSARLTYNDTYGWGTKYGATPEEAFETVRSIIVKVARAARSGDLNAIDQADLGIVTKWKIAFLYQDRDSPCILPLYREESLRIVSDASKADTPATMHTNLLAERKGRDLFEYGQELWEEAAHLLAKQWSGKRALQLLQEREDLVPCKEPTSKVAGFELDDGRQLALDISPSTPAVFLQPGAWLDLISHTLLKITTYAPQDSRHSNLDANAPSLAQGNPAIHISVPDEHSFDALLAAYLEPSSSQLDSEHSNGGAMTGSKQPLNQILFGPPGTGKTYTTINRSLAILAPEYLAQHTDDRTALKERFDQLVHQDRIRFVTFHQSFSYEDFVEGLSATVDGDSGQLTYEVVDGVFKSLCSAAAAKVTHRADAPTDLSKRRVWKMSLGNTLGNDASVYDECIAGSYVLLGYGGAIDFTGCTNRKNVQSCFAEAGVVPENPGNDYGITSVTTFATRMAKGDLVVVSDGNFKLRAIGEITGDYEFKAHADYENGYSQLRPVRWLRQYKPSLPHTELMNNQFSQMTLYELRGPALDREKLQGLLSEEVYLSAEPSMKSASSTMTKAASHQVNARVVIIDEINRGNISRIFGELITLIEPSKRTDGEESLSVTLPYSKKSFSIPSNVYIIGTMNTADRSLAGLDIALRRRFIFKEMPPRADLLNDVYVEDISIRKVLQVMNQRVEVLLDRDHCLGHSYFLPLRKDGSLESLADIFRHQILPLLQEYFFEDWQRIGWVLNDQKAKSNGTQPFIQRPSDEQNLHKLFGNDVANQLNDQRWHLNNAAFTSIESYRNILDEMT